MIGRTSADVVVVGGGVVGSAVAYWLAKRNIGKVGPFEWRLFNEPQILVVERDPTYAKCSTSLSAGSIRLQFSTPENIEICKFSSQFIREIGSHLSIGEEMASVGFYEGGYLFLASKQGVSVLESNHQVQKKHGADVALLSAEQLRVRFPWLNIDGVEKGSLGLSGEGWLDPYGLLQAFKKKAQSLGVTFVQDEVTGFTMTESRVEKVHLRVGGVLNTGFAVNAAGPQAGHVAGLAGIRLPVVPKKRCIFMFQTETVGPQTPLTIDPTGVYWRPEGKGYICGVSPPEDADPDTESLDVDHHLWEDSIWPVIADRVPQFAAVKQTRSWAGLYDYNTFDQNGVVGIHPRIRNMIFANGFSGHGLQQSPAVGRAVAELVNSGKYETLDLSALGYERLVRGENLIEINIV